ncbi:MAG TPA: hypothetical protein VGP82_17830 [Ktedonobacterales bacterium]|nr:hypothetical protein [Ktedonobacterales bacterium]
MPLLDIPQMGEHDMKQAKRTGVPSSAVSCVAASPWRAALVGLALLPLTLALACTSTMRLASAPASSLRMSIRFDLALVPAQTTVSAWLQTNQGTPVALTGGQTLAIDGVPLVADEGNSHFHTTVPHRAPGGPDYTFTYTDEQGHHTVVHIPAPQADFAVLEPTAGSQVPLPRPVGASRARPVATPTPNLADPYQPRPPALADTPLTVRYTLPYQPESVLQEPGPTDTPNQYVVQLSVFGPCAHPGAFPQGCATVGSMCDVVIKDQTAPTGSATVDDRDKAWGLGFETCAPGPGEIRMSTFIAWNVPTAAFGGFYVQFTGVAKAPITWV